MTKVSDIARMINSLSAEDVAELKSLLLSSGVETSYSMEAFLTEERFAKGRECPRCGRTHVVRNGHRPDGIQRYVCKDCGKSFVVSSNTIVEGTRKSLDVWRKFMACMMRGMSIRETAAECGIHRNTAFYWRHKVLDALRKMMAGRALDGIVEMDETFFDVSYKGNHKKSDFEMPRAPHKRGGQTHLRGVSHEKVCVPCAISRTGLAYAKSANLGRASAKSIESVFGGIISSDSTLVTDKHNAYVRFANKGGHELVQLKGKESRKGIYNVQRVNAYHGSLKRLMRNFDGVSTKYLDNYLAWHAFLSYGKDEASDKVATLARGVLSERLTVRCRDISGRNPLPMSV